MGWIDGDFLRGILHTILGKCRLNPMCQKFSITRRRSLCRSFFVSSPEGESQPIFLRPPQAPT